MKKRKAAYLIHVMLALMIMAVAVGTSGCGGGGGGSVEIVPQNPNISATPTQNDFGVVVLGKSADRNITISNTGNGNLDVGTIAPPAGPFSILTDGCSGTTVPPSGNCQLTIRFAPTVQGDPVGSIDIPSNDADTPVATASLAGKARALNVSVNRVDRVGNTVQVIVSVNDQNDLPVTGLAPGSFTIDENGSAVVIQNVSNVMTAAVSVGIVMDYSGSMENVIDNVVTAANSFVDLLTLPPDEAEVIKVGETVQTMQPFTDNLVALQTAIQTPIPLNFVNTFLFDALVQSVNSTAARTNPRKAIVAVSDGNDLGSVSTLTDVTTLAQANDVPIYTIGFVGVGSVDNVVLGQLAEDSGGQYFFSPSAADLEGIYATIAGILGNEYTIDYTTSAAQGATVLLDVFVNSGGNLGEDSRNVVLQ